MVMFLQVQRRLSDLSCNRQLQCVTHGCRRLWQYATQAVLQDLGQHQPRKLTGATLLEWRDQRQRYVELWTHHLQSVKGSSDQVLTA